MDLRTKALSRLEQHNLDRQIRQPAIDLLSSRSAVQAIQMAAEIDPWVQFFCSKRFCTLEQGVSAEVESQLVPTPHNKHLHLLLSESKPESLRGVFILGSSLHPNSASCCIEMNSQCALVASADKGAGMIT